MKTKKNIESPVFSRLWVNWIGIKIYFTQSIHIAQKGRSIYKIEHFIFFLFVYDCIVFVLLYFFYPGLWQHKKNEMRHHIAMWLCHSMLYTSVSKWLCVFFFCFLLLLCFWHTLPNEPLYGSRIHIFLLFHVENNIIIFKKAFCFIHNDSVLVHLLLKFMWPLSLQYKNLKCLDLQRKKFYKMENGTIEWW